MNAAQGSALPARWRRGRILASSAAFLLTAVVVTVLLPLGRADSLDTWWLSARFTVREKFNRHRDPDPDIVLALLDDKCADAWPEPTVAWDPHIADALDKLRLSGARVIALDWIQPASTEQYFKGNDARLQQALLQQTNIVFVKELRPDWGTQKFQHTIESLLFAVPEAAQSGAESLQGFAEFPLNSSITATVLPALPGSQTDISFAARIAERWYGRRSQIQGGYWEIPGAVRVKLREDGTVLANFADGSGTNQVGTEPFSQISLSEIAKQPAIQFKNKIVLIGEAYSGGNDQHFIPFLDGFSRNRLALGVQIQANFLRTLLHERAINEPLPALRWTLCIVLALVSIVFYLRLRWIHASLALLSIGAGWIVLSFVVFCSASYALPILLPLGSLSLSGGIIGGYLAFSEERERRQVMKLWGRYQDARLVNYLLLYPEARGGEGSEVPATVLFADLKNFTKTVEMLSPSEALHVLNRYLSLLEVVTIDHGGLVDKYLGDGLMAQWGAPSATDGSFRKDHAEAAVSACLEIQKRAAELRALEPNAIHFGLRLTLHTGPVVVGWVGASRLEFTIIGDTVNVTARLQETAKQLDVEFLISESTYEYVKDRVTTGKQAEVEIRGRIQPLLVYEVTGGK